MKILMVCLGNICRSPLAQGILERKKPEWKVDSAGTAAYHVGHPPDPRSQKTAKRNHIDISNQRARQITNADLEHFDLICTMDTENYNNVLKLADSEEQKSKVKLILNYAFPGSNRVVPDPYYNDRFDEVYELLDLATEAIIEEYS